MILALVLVVSGVGWFQHSLWGWRLAVAVIATQVIGDIVNLVRGDLLRGGIGVIIACALLLYLLTPRIRAAFSGIHDVFSAHQGVEIDGMNVVCLGWKSNRACARLGTDRNLSDLSLQWRPTPRAPSG